MRRLRDISKAAGICCDIVCATLLMGKEDPSRDVIEGRDILSQLL